MDFGDFDGDGDFELEEANQIIGPLGWLFAPISILIIILLLVWIF